LETMKDITIVEPMVSIRSVMTDDNLHQMEQLADALTEQ